MASSAERLTFSRVKVTPPAMVKTTSSPSWNAAARAGLALALAEIGQVDPVQAVLEIFDRVGPAFLVEDEAVIAIAARKDVEAATVANFVVPGAAGQQVVGVVAFDPGPGHGPVSPVVVQQCHSTGYQLAIPDDRCDVATGA
ncbi:MAG: hypothetical protein QE280_11845 [Caulobacter sp.]|nr:hypothetical protein [Caulobacter sp.]